MESQVIRLMKLKRYIDLYAMARQISIRDGRYEDAMTNQFFFYMNMDEYLNKKKNLSNKEMMEIIKAMICIDYK